MHYQNSIVFTQTMDLYLDSLSSLKTTDYAFMRGVIRAGQSYFVQLQGISSIYALQVQKINRGSEPSNMNDIDAVDEIINNVREYSDYVEQKKSQVNAEAAAAVPVYSGRGRRAAAGVNNPTTVARKNRLIKNIGNLKYDVYVVRFMLRRSQMTMRSVKTGAKLYDGNELLHANTKIMVPDFIFYDWLLTAFKNSFPEVDLDKVKFKTNNKLINTQQMSREEEILRVIADKSKILILSARSFNHFIALRKAKSLKRGNMFSNVLNENTLVNNSSKSSTTSSTSATASNSDNGEVRREERKRAKLTSVYNRLLCLRNEKHSDRSILLNAEIVLLRHLLDTKMSQLIEMPHDKIIDGAYIVCFMRFTFGVHSLFNMRVAGNNPYLFRDIEDRRIVSVSGTTTTTTTTATNASSAHNGGKRGRPPLNRQIVDLVNVRSNGVSNPRGRPPGSANRQTADSATRNNNYAIVTRQRRTNNVNDTTNENLLNVNLNVATRKRRGRKPKNSAEQTEVVNENNGLVHHHHHQSGGNARFSITSSENNSPTNTHTHTNVVVNSVTTTQRKTRGRPPKVKNHSNVATDNYEIIDEEQVLPPLFTPKKKQISVVEDNFFANDNEIKQVVYNSISSMSINRKEENNTDKYIGHVTNQPSYNSNITNASAAADGSKYNNEAMLISQERKPLIEVPQPNPQQQEQCEYIVNLSPLAKKIMSRWKSESMFNHEYTMFVSVNNMVPPKLPMIAFVSINLYMMMQGGLENGGYKMINRDRKWKNIYYCLEPKTEITNATTCTRRHYERLLLPFEEYLIKLYFMELTIEYTSGGVVNTENKSPNAIKAILNQIYPYLFDLDEKSVNSVSNSKDSSVLTIKNNSIVKPAQTLSSMVEQVKEVEVDLNQEVDDRSQFMVEELITTANNNQSAQQVNPPPNQNVQQQNGSYVSGQSYCEYREDLLPYNIDVEHQNYQQMYNNYNQQAYTYPEEQQQSEYVYAQNQELHDYYYYGGGGGGNDAYYYYTNNYNYPEHYAPTYDYNNNYNEVNNNYQYKYEYNNNNNQGYYAQSPNTYNHNNQNNNNNQYYTYYAPEYMASFNQQTPPPNPNGNNNTHVHNVNNRKLK